MAASRYSTWMRMYMRWPRWPVPGICARTPIVSGCAAVSQTLTVAHSLGDATGLARATTARARGSDTGLHPRP